MGVRSVARMIRLLDGSNGNPRLTGLHAVETEVRLDVGL